MFIGVLNPNLTFANECFYTLEFSRKVLISRLITSSLFNQTIDDYVRILLYKIMLHFSDFLIHSTISVYWHIFCCKVKVFGVTNHILNNGSYGVPINVKIECLFLVMRTVSVEVGAYIGLQFDMKKPCTTLLIDFDGLVQNQWTRQIL